jgi:DNA gyrase subunit A
MAEIAREVAPVNLEDEMRQSYLDYAMSVIVGRALPDVRDGLKPVHRRVLHAMRELGNDHNKPYKKSARIVGDVIGKYHPHGDTAVYDTMVRMAQPFSMRYVLIDGQGNFGSVDGDAPAAMRYTEVRMAKLAHELLADIDKETVDFVPNYDESETEPAVLPTRLPNLLVNGSAGIAVGMATNIPPHNLREVVDGCIALIDDPTLTIQQLMQHIPGPDFPTAGMIHGARGILEAYHTGRGRIVLRAKVEVETDPKNGKDSLIVTELPYMVNKARLLERIAELVKEKKVEGITELRDESDKDGMRMVIELRKGENAEIMINNLYQHTALQTVFGINTVALVDGQPRLLNLKQLLEAFIRHRREVVTRRTIFELRKARERAHVLEGLAVALADIDEMIALIKKAPNPAIAKDQIVARPWQPGIVRDMLARAGAEASRPDGLPPTIGLLHDGYHMSEVQAQAILDLKLQRLTGLEQDKIVQEYAELLERIGELRAILADVAKLMGVIRGELLAVREEYGDDRRTAIHHDGADLTIEDLIEEQDVVVTLSHAGYAKAQPVSEYRVQRRGGRGKTATKVKDEDFIERLVVVNTHDTVLCFSDRGRVYWLKVWQIPQASRESRGRPIVNLLPLEDGERITALLPLEAEAEAEGAKGAGKAEGFVFMATSSGVVKKTALSEFSRPRPSGIIAVELRPEDSLVGVALTRGADEVMLFASNGKSIRFAEDEVRPMGRAATGVRGITLAAGAKVVGLVIPRDGHVLTATSNGYGKRTPVSDYPLQGRGGQGVISIQTTERNGPVVGAILVAEGDELMLISDGGTLVRTAAADVSVVGRNTQGVRLIRLGDGEQLTGVERSEALEDESGPEA